MVYFLFIVEYNNSAAVKTAWLSINYNNNRHLSRATVIVFLHLVEYNNSVAFNIGRY